MRTFDVQASADTSSYPVWLRRGAVGATSITIVALTAAAAVSLKAPRHPGRDSPTRSTARMKELAPDT